MPFTMQPPAEKKPRKQFKPKPVAELQSFYTQAKIKPPPDVIKDPQVFDWSCDFWMSFDVETHDLAPKTDKKGWVQDEFGHKVRPEVRNLRVVQLGWTVGSFKPDMVPVTKVRCVKPVGFNIALAAEAIHKLSTEYVTMNGKCFTTETETETRSRQHYQNEGTTASGRYHGAYHQAKRGR
jgi:hypothetical protein